MYMLFFFNNRGSNLMKEYNGKKYVKVNGQLKEVNQGDLDKAYKAVADKMRQRDQLKEGSPSKTTNTLYIFRERVDTQWSLTDCEAKVLTTLDTISTDELDGFVIDKTTIINYKDMVEYLNNSPDVVAKVVFQDSWGFLVHSYPIGVIVSSEDQVFY